jgi:hypothetical protein
MINWQFRSAPLPRPNPHLLREDGGVRANFVQNCLRLLAERVHNCGTAYKPTRTN